MNIERPGSPSAKIVAPASKLRSDSIETKRSRLASERPPKKGVASKNAFRSGELTGIYPIYPQPPQRQDWNQLSGPGAPASCNGSLQRTTSPHSGQVRWSTGTSHAL